MISQPYENRELRIKDFTFDSVQSVHYSAVSVGNFCYIFSYEDEAECKELFRAVVNAFIRLKIHKDGQQTDRNRQRKRIINYHKMPDWAWGNCLLDAAKQYEMAENRPQHKAVFEVMGNRVNFETPERRIVDS